MTPLRHHMIEDLILRNRAPRTIKAYPDVSPISRHFNAAPEGLGPEQVRSYLLHLVQERHVSWSYYNQARCPLRFFHRVTLGKDCVVQEVACPKVPKRLPKVLSPDELVRFFKQRPKTGLGLWWTSEPNDSVSHSRAVDCAC